MAAAREDGTISGAIWIRPGGAAAAELQAVIDELQQRCGGPGGTPHLALLSGIHTSAGDGQRKLSRLATRVRPFEVELGDIDFGDDYYRCLYVRALPSRELEAARRAALEVFGAPMQAGDGWHVPLLYGEESLDTRRALAREFGSRVRRSFAVDSLELVNAARGVPVSQWHGIARARLRDDAQRRQRTLGGVPYSQVGGG
ncbi:MAG TPA: hypothetical protein VHE37_15815 [Nevskiaceae bacterium]|nr:hypothetical protein [Nevskiaceae bacterium]